MNVIVPNWRKRTRITVTAVGALLIGLVIAGFVVRGQLDTNRSQRVSGGGEQIVPVTLKDFDVVPGTLVVDAGTHLFLDVVNNGRQTHDLALDGSLRTSKMHTGDTQRLDVGTVSADLYLICTRPGHEFLGMKLRIRAVPQEASTSGSPTTETVPQATAQTPER